MIRQEILALCEKAETLEFSPGATPTEDRAVLTFPACHLSGREARAVRSFLRQLDRQADREKRAFDKKHAWLMRTNPEYREIMIGIKRRVDAVAGKAV